MSEEIRLNNNSGEISNKEEVKIHGSDDQKEINHPPQANDKKLLELEQNLASVNEKLLRALAESDNLRRRNREEVEKANKYGISNFANDLVLVVENFYLAVDNMPKDEVEKNSSFKNFAEAVIMTKKELVKVFEKNGIKRIYPINEKFDYNYHEAVSRVDSDLDEDSVVQVIQAGYLIGDRLIRPALVTVAAKKE